MQAYQDVCNFLGQHAKAPPPSKLSLAVTSSNFDTLTAVVITANSLFIGVVTDDAVTGGDVKPGWMKGLELSFQLFYICELFLKLAAHRLYFLIGPDWNWNLFDAFLVVTALYDIYNDWLVNSEDGKFNITFLRALKILKMVKILRIFRVMRFFRELRLILNSIGGSMRSLFWSWVMLMLIYYIFGLAFTQAVTPLIIAADTDTDVKELMIFHWGSVYTSMLTLYKSTTGGVDWAEPAVSLGAVSRAWFLVFCTYIIFMICAVLNILTGIFVENAMKAAQDDNENMIGEHLAKEMSICKRLKKFCHQMDVDKSGTISWDEFKQHMEVAEMTAYLSAIDISMMDIQVFYEMLSDTLDQSEIAIDMLVDGMMKMKGHARGIDLQVLQWEFRQQTREQAAFHHIVVEHFERSEPAGRGRLGDTPKRPPVKNGTDRGSRAIGRSSEAIAAADTSEGPLRAPGGAEDSRVAATEGNVRMFV